MRKILFSLFLLFVSCAFAQKSYITLSYEGDYLKLTGSLPSGIESKYNTALVNISLGDLLNKLSKQGFEVEFVTQRGTSDVLFILSSLDSSNSSNSIKSYRLDEEEEIYEVARFNLQGVPVSEHEKGLQVIVYSNYTTKTVLIE